MINKNRMWLAVILVVLTIALALTGCASVPVADTSGTQPVAAGAVVQNTSGTGLIDLQGNEIIADTLTVSANGSKKIMPDVAYVTVGVTTQNKKTKDAQSNNKETMNALYAALKAAGLTEDDLRTVSYSVYPMYDYSNGSKITGYEVTNMIELTIKDIDSIGDYIDIAAATGANTNYSINFDLLDESGVYNEALADAMSKAKSKADTLASAGGYEIINTLEITEGQNSYPTSYAEYSRAADDEKASTTISAGQMEITASITVVYQIK